MTLLLIFTATLFVAYANGANDNFKGVATLFGSGSANYKQAITLATAATFAGCIASVFLAAGLVHAFSGKGLCPMRSPPLRIFCWPWPSARAAP